MDSIRRIYLTLFCVSFLLGSFPLIVYSDDYISAKVTVIKKALTTASGQEMEYPRTGKPEVTALLVEIPSGSETGWHLHPVPVYAYVLSGTLTSEMENGERRDYKEGEAIFEAVNTPHNGKNLGEIPVKLIVFYTGEEGKPVTVRVKHE
jgi:quercetin dioxygenase-like cupin family protein